MNFTLPFKISGIFICVLFLLLTFHHGTSALAESDDNTGTGTGMPALIPPEHPMPPADQQQMNAQPATESEPQKANGDTKPSPNPKAKQSKEPARKEKQTTKKKSETPAAVVSADDNLQLLRSGSELLKNGEFKEATEKFQVIINRSSSVEPKYLAAAYSQAAKALQRSSESDKALEYISKAIALHLTLKNAHARSLDLIFTGRIHLEKENHGEALKYLEEGLKLLPASESAETPKVMEEIALCHVKLQKPAEAVNYYSKSASAFSKNGNEIEAVRLYLQIGELQIARSDYKGAKSSFKKAEKYFKDQSKEKELSDVLNRIAYVEQLSGETAPVPAPIEDNRKIAEKPKENNEPLPLMVQGIAAYNEGKIAQAVKSLNDALLHYQQAGDAQMVARVRLVLGNVEMDRARLESALELARMSLDEFRKMGSSSGEAASLQLIGEVYFRQGFVKKALEYGLESLSLAKKTGDKNQSVLSAILLADIFTGTGDAEAASKMLKEAVDDARAISNKKTKAQLKLAVVRFRISRESLDKAIQDAGDARKDFAELGDRRGIADTDHLMGVAYEMRGDRDKSKALLEQALSEHVALWDRFGEGRGLTALGIHYKNAGDYDKALEYFQKSLDLRKGIGDLRGNAANLANIGNMLRHKNQIIDASANLESALSIYREILDKKGEADILTNIANLDAARGMPAAALEKYSAALKLHREVMDNRGIATDLVGMGKIYLARGDLNKAGECLDEADKVNKKIRNPKGDLVILSEIAMLQRSKGNPKAALTSLEQALELAKKFDDKQSMSSLNLKIATLLEDAGNYDKAMVLLQETLKSMRNQGDKKGELWALGGIGIIQVRMEDYENALKNLREALRLRNELGVPPDQSRDLDFYIGEIYEGFKDYERALEHYQKASSESQSPGNDSNAGKIYGRMADVYYRMEEYAKARDFYEDALRIHSETKDVRKQKQELLRLGDIYSKLGEPENALKYHQRALNLASDTHDARMQGRVLSRIGTINQLLGKPKIALENYRDAQEIRTKLGDKRGISENLLQIALVTSNLGDSESAVNDLKKAFEIAHCSDDRGTLWKAYFIMGRTLENKNKLGEALEAYRKAITVLDSTEADIMEDTDEDDFIFGGRSALFDTALRVLMKLARKDPEGAYDNQALRIVEKLKAAEFEAMLSRINVDNFSDLPQDLLIKEKSLKLHIRKLNSRISEELSKGSTDQTVMQKLITDRKAKEKAFQELKQKLTKEYPVYAELRYPKTLSIHQLQKNAVDSDEAVIQYMVTRSKTYIFALDKQRFYTFSVDYAGKDLERDVDALTRPLQRAETLSSWDPSLAYKIYSRIIHPVEAFLIGKKSVVVIPHGPLALLPFEILVDSKSHAAKRFWSANDRPGYLLEKYAFCYAPSMSVFNQLRTREKRQKAGWNLAAFGDAVYQDPDKKREMNPGAERIAAMLAGQTKNNRNNELKSLPGARREITEIMKIVNGPMQPYFGPEATESLFKKVDLTRYNYIHLATHGVLLTGSGRMQQQPAIVFSLYGDSENDGFLQMGEVFGLKLNADLVVLSSCQIPAKSGLGEAAGPFGLARAFLFAGADSIVLSMWQVSDEYASKLFVDMYRFLKDTGKAEALQKAKLQFLTNSATSHPYYWAPFILVGNWNNRVDTGVNKMFTDDGSVNTLSPWRKLLSR